MNRRDFLKLALASSLAGSAISPAAAKTKERSIPHRTLGRTGARVSAIGIGGFHLGKAESEEESTRIVRTAVDHGVNFMDNCWDYHDGESERRMGRALRDGYRKRVFLMTKIDGRDAETARKQLDESLARLETDHVDLLQFHEVIRDSDPGRIFAKGGALEAVVEAQKAGKVRFIGFTGHKSPEIHLKMLATADKHKFRFDAVQLPLNLMDAHYESFEKKVLPVLVEQTIGVLGMKPLGSGKLLETNAVTPQECLRYAMSLKTSVVITGCESMAILNQALDVAHMFDPMDAAEKRVVRAKTAELAKQGSYELYKTSQQFDATERNPQWLGSGGGSSS